MIEMTAESLKEVTKDKFGRYNLTKVMSLVENINDLKQLVGILTGGFTNDELRRTWHFADEMPDETVQEYKDNVTAFADNFYNRVENLNDSVLCVDIETSDIDNRIVYTFIVPLKYRKRVFKKFFEYDQGLRDFIKDDEHRKQIRENLAKDESYDCLDGTNIVTLRLLSGRGLYYGENGHSIQVSSANLLGSMKTCVVQPWGFFDFSEFCCGVKIKEISIEEMEHMVEDFINRHNLTSILEIQNE